MITQPDRTGYTCNRCTHQDYGYQSWHRLNQFDLIMDLIVNLFCDLIGVLFSDVIEPKYSDFFDFVSQLVISILHEYNIIKY